MEYTFKKMLVLSLKKKMTNLMWSNLRIFVVQKQLLLLVTLLDTIQFSEHYHDVVVTKPSRYMYVWAKTY